MSKRADLEKRLRFFGINSNTKRYISGFMPILLPRIDGFAENFYGHTMNFPEARRILTPHYNNRGLKDRQVKHWIRLFLCKFDQQYFDYALKIGQIHYVNKVFPYLYIGGYNFIQSEIINLASAHYSDAKVRSNVLTAISRVIALDMDLALSAYTREHWSRMRAPTPKKMTNPPPVKSESPNMTEVLIC